MTIFVFAVLTNRPDATFLSVAVVGACIGFLLYNFHPASIFMGDSGRLASWVLAWGRLAFRRGALGPFRVASGTHPGGGGPHHRHRVRHRAPQAVAPAPIDEADKGHIHHRLMKAGFGQRATVLIMWGWTAVLALCAILFTEIHGLARIPIFCVLAGVTVFAIAKLHLLEPVLRHHYHPREKNPADKE